MKRMFNTYCLLTERKYFCYKKLQFLIAFQISICGSIKVKGKRITQVIYLKVPSLSLGEKLLMSSDEQIKRSNEFIIVDMMTSGLFLFLKFNFSSRAVKVLLFIFYM